MMVIWRKPLLDLKLKTPAFNKPFGELFKLILTPRKTATRYWGHSVPYFYLISNNYMSLIICI